MDKKQTAVEWLQEQLNPDMKTMQGNIIQDLLDQAKQMEKEQLIDAYYQCGRDNFEHIKVINRSATDYYNETYG